MFLYSNAGDLLFCYLAEKAEKRKAEKQKSGKRKAEQQKTEKLNVEQQKAERRDEPHEAAQRSQDAAQDIHVQDMRSDR